VISESLASRIFDFDDCIKHMQAPRAQLRQNSLGHDACEYSVVIIALHLPPRSTTIQIHKNVCGKVSFIKTYSIETPGDHQLDKDLHQHTNDRKLNYTNVIDLLGRAHPVI
jgi:hypothetical protein